MEMANQSATKSFSEKLEGWRHTASQQVTDFQTKNRDRPSSAHVKKLRQSSKRPTSASVHRPQRNNHSNTSYSSNNHSNINHHTTHFNIGNNDNSQNNNYRPPLNTKMINDSNRAQDPHLHSSRSLLSFRSYQQHNPTSGSPDLHLNIDNIQIQQQHQQDQVYYQHQPDHSAGTSPAKAAKDRKIRFSDDRTKERPRTKDRPQSAVTYDTQPHAHHTYASSRSHTPFTSHNHSRNNDHYNDDEYGHQRQRPINSRSQSRLSLSSRSTLSSRSKTKARHSKSTSNLNFHQHRHRGSLKSRFKNKSSKQTGSTQKSKSKYAVSSKDRESLRQELLTLKKTHHAAMTQNKDLQVKVKRAHAQLKKKDKEYEELLVSTAEFNGDPTGALRAMRSEKLLIKTLLARISQLEKENNSKAEEMKQIKSSSKYTRWAQMQDELADQTEEIQRLNYIIRAQREDFREDRTRIIQEYEAKVTKYKEKINGLDSMLVVARGEIEALAKDQLITHHHRQEAETKVSRLSQLCEENNIEVEDNPRESNPLITNTSMSGSSTNNANNDSVRLDDDIDNDLDYVDDHE